MTTTDRAATYLDDLARMLVDLEPAERDEVLAGVREHLDASVAEHPDDPAVLDRALARLGPPERIAAEARAGLPSRPAAHAPDRRRRVRVAAIVSIAIVGLPVGWSLLSRVLQEVVTASGDGWPTSVALLPHPSELLISIPLAFPAWIVAVALAVVGAALSVPTKAALLTLGPVSLFAVGLSTALGEPILRNTVIVFVVLGAAVIAIGWTVRRVVTETR